MIRTRALESPGDLCCLPSPHKVPQGVAGMAFNFSQVEISNSAHRDAPTKAETQRGATQSSMVKQARASFALCAAFARDLIHPAV